MGETVERIRNQVAEIKIKSSKQSSMLVTLIAAMALSGCGGVGTDAPGLNY